MNNQALAFIGLGSLGIGFYYRNVLLEKLENYQTFRELEQKLFPLYSRVCWAFEHEKDEEELDQVRIIVRRIWKVDGTKAEIIKEVDYEEAQKLKTISLDLLNLEQSDRYLIEYQWEDFPDHYIIPFTLEQLEQGFSTNGYWLDELSTPEEYIDLILSEYQSVHIKNILQAYAGPYKNFYHDSSWMIQGRDIYDLWETNCLILKEGQFIIARDPILEDEIRLS